MRNAKQGNDLKRWIRITIKWNLWLVTKMDLTQFTKRLGNRILNNLIVFFYQSLQLLTRAATTRTSMQPTASNLSLDKSQSVVIRETSPLAGIALLVLLVTQRCPLHVQLCVVVVRMPQDGSKDNILLLQTVKWLVQFAIIGQTIVVGGKTTLKLRTAAPFTCMSCKKRLHAGFDTVVSGDILR